MLFSYSGLSKLEHPQEFLQVLDETLGKKPSVTDNKYVCDFSFYCRYGLKLPSIPSTPLVFGKSNHAIIETAIREKNPDIIPSLVSAIASANDLDEDELYKCVTANAVEAAIKEGGVVEEYFQSPLDDSPLSPEIRGYIDLYQDKGTHIQLTDWKTNRATYKPTDTYQLGIYAGYLKEKYKKPVIGRLAFLRFNKVEEHEYTKADIKEAQIWATETAYRAENLLEKVQAGMSALEAFPKRPGDTCEYCDYKNMCLSEELAIPETIIEPQDAEKVAHYITTTKAVLKAQEEKLKQFILGYGEIKGSRYQVSMNTSEYLKFSLEARKAVVNRMQEKGIDVGSVLKIGSDAQKDLMDKYGWNQKEFFDLGATMGKTTRLDIKLI